jgi:hypothetical protein
MAHGRDCCNVSIGEIDCEGYLPSDLGIGGGDDMRISVCLDCGQLQGTWPLPISNFERGTKDDLDYF